MNCLVDCKNVSFSYGDVPLLKNVNFSAQEGEYIGIAGPNGSGKSTAFQLLMGFLKPQKGKILIDNRSPIEARTIIGYVPQHPDIDRQFPLSLLDFVLTGLVDSLTLWGRHSKRSKELAQQALEQVGLTNLNQHRLGTLSGGQMQKAFIARALVGKPKILLLDEPTAHVDPSSEKQIFEIIRNLKKKHTILMITHDFEHLIPDFDRVLLFHKQVTSLKPEELCHHFALGIYHDPKQHHPEDS